MGHSWGGLQAISFVLHNSGSIRADRIEGLIALAPGYGDRAISTTMASVLSLLPQGLQLRETHTSGTVTKDARDLEITREELAKIVEEADTNSNGFLELNEVETILNDRLKLHLSISDIEEEVKLYDTNR